MNIRIKTTSGYEMGEDVSDYIEDRMMAVRKHLGAANSVVRCEVEIGRVAGHSRHGENYFAEIQLVRPGEKLIRAVAQGETVQAAIDAVKDETLALLRKEKTRTSLRLRRVSAQVKEWMRWGR